MVPGIERTTSLRTNAEAAGQVLQLDLLRRFGHGNRAADVQVTQRCGQKVKDNQPC